jgi:hypothetical protein
MDHSVVRIIRIITQPITKNDAPDPCLGHVLFCLFTVKEIRVAKVLFQCGGRTFIRSLFSI